MDSKKQRNRSIERKKRNKQNLFRGIMALIGIAIIGAIGFAIWDGLNRRTIMTFEGNRIATSDFRFFYLGQEPALGTTQRDNAMEALVSTLTILDRAERHNLTVSPEDRAEINEMVANLNLQSPPGFLNFISDERIVELFSIDNLGDQLMDIYFPDTLTEDELAEMVEEHLEEFRAHWETMNLKYIVSTDVGAMESAQTALESGADFDTVARTYCEAHQDGEEVAVMEFWDFVQEYQTWDFLMEIFELEIGEITETLVTEDHFFIIQMYERIVDYDAVADALRNEARFGDFHEMVDEWIAEANYEINYRAFNRF
ncbi:MAG: peptidyl-prolyl cis-trans isomerase [Defluviitaleaceae bacterium]|nr:peptidyl-prolyl cis-trans isomerase [Defluviitaleaceae bacterium]